MLFEFNQLFASSLENILVYTNKNVTINPNAVYDGDEFLRKNKHMRKNPNRLSYYYRVFGSYGLYQLALLKTQALFYDALYTLPKYSMLENESDYVRVRPSTDQRFNMLYVVEHDRQIEENESKWWRKVLNKFT